MEITLISEDVLEFIKMFPDDESCREFIAGEKWKDSYKCKRCGNTKYVYFEKHNKRECTKCRYNESATAGTLFHRVKFGIQKAFCIAYEVTCTNKPISSIQIARRYKITQKTAWMFIQKVKLALKAFRNNASNGNLNTDGFVFGMLISNDGKSDSETDACGDAVSAEEGEIKQVMQLLLFVMLQNR